jgi:hypothetical protein
MCVKFGIRPSLLILLLTGIFILNLSLKANSQKYPVDISFYAADLKYSKKTGVKICEVQHGILSFFRGERFSYGRLGTTAPNFIKFISQLPGPLWMNRNIIADAGLRKILRSYDYRQIDVVSQLFNNPDFCLKASLPLADPTDISSYHGIAYFRQSDFKDIDAIRSKYPGIIFMDSAGHDYWIDKYKMTLLFEKDPQLGKFKPRWNLYKKEYSSDLAVQIINDLQCDRVVIKPRSSFRGRGVMIVDKEDLDAVLNYIFQKTDKLKTDEDLCTRYWFSDDSTTFIVEEFIAADPLRITHLEDDRLYEPTVRVSFFLVYNKNIISVIHCGAYYRFPCKSLEEPGTLNEKYKDIIELPYFDKVEPEIYDKIKEDLDIALPLLYKQMLK